MQIVNHLMEGMILYMEIVNHLMEGMILYMQIVDHLEGTLETQIKNVHK